MKRYGNLFNKITSIENILEAHRQARKDKSHYKEVQKVDEDPLFYARIIKYILDNEIYQVGKYKREIINDRGKERELMKLPYYPDRIIQWAILLQLEPILLNKFIKQTCASIPGRGIHTAWAYMQKYLKDEAGTKYCLKMDVRKFYDNVDHDTLKNMLRKTFKDEKLLRLLFKIIDSYPLDKGIPIGSYLSQYFGNFYLHTLDHYIKEHLHCKYYIRYMDDMVILSDDKEELRFILNQIQNYLAFYLKLQLKDNYQIFPTKTRGVDFVGYRFFGDYTLLRKRVAKNFKSKMRKLEKKTDYDNRDLSTVCSYIGWLKYCDSYRLKDKYVGGLYEKIRSSTKGDKQ